MFLFLVQLAFAGDVTIVPPKANTCQAEQDRYKVATRYSGRCRDDMRMESVYWPGRVSALMDDQLPVFKHCLQETVGSSIYQARIDIWFMYDAVVQVRFDYSTLHEEGYVWYPGVSKPADKLPSRCLARAIGLIRWPQQTFEDTHVVWDLNVTSVPSNEELLDIDAILESLPPEDPPRVDHVFRAEPEVEGER